MIRQLGRKIRSLRKRDRLSQTELARRIGLSDNSRGYISEIENGKKVPPVELVVRMAQAFKVSTDYLLRDDVGVTENEG